MLVTGAHDPYLVALSILVAAFASYTAFDLGGHVATAQGHKRYVWLATAAIAMGGGLWSMHFVLDFILPVPTSYDVELTILSLLVAMLVTGGSFYIISRYGTRPLPLVFSGALMGVGISTMHFIGMAAIREHTELSYDPQFIVLSLAIAIGASTAALRLAFRNTNSGRKFIAAAIMGLAIAGMHYAAIEGTTFSAGTLENKARALASLDRAGIALAIAAITFVILTFALIASRTKQKRTEEALREARANLARINRATTMGELAAALAHEINQPIAAAVTNADACMSWLARDPPNLDKARASAAKMAQNGEHAADIIRRVRTLFEKGTPQRVSVDINEVIQELIVLLRGEMTRHCISVRTELAADLPRIAGDRVQLQQVMMNLIMNSVDAMKSVDGFRELAIRSWRADDGALMVCVADSGVGLPPQAADQIFHAFFTTKVHGVGMGLSICRSIVEAHSGRLWAADNTPRGASFHVTLPTRAATVH
jgi:NO-binding membrane sensor protein with MHYT domain